MLNFIVLYFVIIDYDDYYITSIMIVKQKNNQPEYLSPISKSDLIF